MQFFSPLFYTWQRFQLHPVYDFQVHPGPHSHQNALIWSIWDETLKLQRFTAEILWLECLHVLRFSLYFNANITWAREFVGFIGVCDWIQEVLQMFTQLTLQIESVRSWCGEVVFGQQSDFNWLVVSSFYTSQLFSLLLRLNSLRPGKILYMF